MGEAENPNFHDFGLFGRVPEPQNQYYSSLETPEYLNQFKRNPEAFWKPIIGGNLKTCDIPNVENVGNDGRHKFQTVRLISS